MSGPDLRFIRFSDEELIAELVKRSDCIVVIRDFKDENGPRKTGHAFIPSGSGLEHAILLSGRASAAIFSAYTIQKKEDTDGDQ